MPTLLSLSRPFTSSSSVQPPNISPQSVPSSLRPTPSTPTSNTSTPSSTASNLISLVKRPVSGKGPKRSASTLVQPTVDMGVAVGVGISSGATAAMLQTSYLEQISLQISDAVNKVFLSPAVSNGKIGQPWLGMFERCKNVGDKIELVLRENLKDIFIFRSVLRSGVLKNLSILHDRLSGILGPILSSDSEDLGSLIVSQPTISTQLSHSNNKDPFITLSDANRIQLEILASGRYILSSLERVEEALLKQLGGGSSKEPSLMLLRSWIGKFDVLIMKVIDPVIAKVRKEVGVVGFRGCSRSGGSTTPPNAPNVPAAPLTGKQGTHPSLRGLSPSPSPHLSLQALLHLPPNTPTHLVHLARILSLTKTFLEKAGFQEGDDRMRKWAVGIAIAGVWKCMLGWGRWKYDPACGVDAKKARDSMMGSSLTGGAGGGRASGTSTPSGGGRGVFKPISLFGNKTSMANGASLGHQPPVESSISAVPTRSSSPPKTNGSQNPSSTHGSTSTSSPHQPFTSILSEISILQTIVNRFLIGVVDWELPRVVTSHKTCGCEMCSIFREGRKEKGKDEVGQSTFDGDVDGAEALASRAMGEAMECLRGFSVIVKSLETSAFKESILLLHSSPAPVLCPSFLSSLSLVPSPILLDLLITSQPISSHLVYPNRIWGISDEKWVGEYLKGFSSAEEWKEGYEAEVEKSADEMREGEWRDIIRTLIRVKEEIESEESDEED